MRQDLDLGGAVLQGQLVKDNRDLLVIEPCSSRFHTSSIGSERSGCLVGFVLECTMAEELVPVFYVRNGIKAIRWYARLGFSIEGEYQFAPGVPQYVCLRRGQVALHLSEDMGDAPPNSLVRFYVADIERIAVEFNVKVKDLPSSYEVELTDLDGNRLRVGMRKALGPLK